MGTFQTMIRTSDLARMIEIRKQLTLEKDWNKIQFLQEEWKSLRDKYMLDVTENVMYTELKE